MTTELEQEFYDTFGIEKQMAATVSCTPGYLKCEHCEYYKHIEEYKGRCTKLDYPRITAEKLLKIICILNNYFKYNCWALTVTTLKYAILKNCIEIIVDKLLDDDVLEQFKQQIQQLFKD